jgi:hypothetical protein
MSIIFPVLPFWSWIGLFFSAFFIGMAKGGKVSASSRADGCCVKGKTKGRMI